MKFPKVSFLTATYNNGTQIPALLESIKRQDYPKDKIEHVIADANSTDNTTKIAKRYGCKIIINEKLNCEYGYLKAYNAANGEIRFFVSADNVLGDENWIRKMVMPFLEDKEIAGAYCSFGIDKKDNSINKYVTMACDPFTNFVYGKGANIWQFPKFFKIKEKGGNWQIYDFSSIDYPLLCFDQGFALKKGYKRPEGSEFCDIIPVVEMLKSGKKIAHVTNTYTLHYCYHGFKHFISKINRKISNALSTDKFGMVYRDKIYGNREREFRKFLWVFYASSVIFPVAYSIKKFIKTGKTYWFYEFPVSVIMFFLLAKNISKKYFLKRRVEYTYHGKTISSM